MTDETPVTQLPREDAFGVESVRELIKLLGQTDVSELLIEREGVKLHIKRGVTTIVANAPAAPATSYAPAAPAPQQSSPVADIPAGYTITAPMVGTYYASPTPNSAPFVQEGDEVAIGDTVGIIEAMKVMNEIESEVVGRVAKILVKSGQPVEYGHPLMIIEPL